MSFSRTLTSLLILLILVQSIVASSDVHIIYEDIQSLHLDVFSVQNIDAHDRSADDCAHCCHVHGAYSAIVSQSSHSYSLLKMNLNHSYNYIYLSPIQSSVIRPPIS